MLIDKRPVIDFLEGSLRAIQDASFPVHTSPCPHCGIPVRYPIIARQSDIEAFTVIIDSAQRVIDKYGITLNLLAEIKAKCYVEIARRKVLMGDAL